jgi:hypothetical protein
VSAVQCVEWSECSVCVCVCWSGVELSGVCAVERMCALVGVECVCLCVLVGVE